MKAAIILWIACALLISTGCSQSNKIVKGYAYAREIIPGVKPGVSLNEDGTITARHNLPGIQYLIYIETTDTAQLQVKGLWINDDEYLAGAEKIKEIPMEIAKDSFTLNRDKQESGNLFIWQINVGEKISSPGKLSKRPSRLKYPGIVISFLFKNKIQYFSISKLQYLEPMRLQ